MNYLLVIGVSVKYYIFESTRGIIMFAFAIAFFLFLMFTKLLLCIFMTLKP